MQISMGNFRSSLFLLALLVLILFPSIVLYASDYSNNDFSVRLPPAFLRFTEVSTMGGETAANRFSSAVNPASLNWTTLPGKNGIVASPYYSFLNFQAGMNLNLFGESMTWDSQSWGVFQPTLSQIRTNNTTARDGLTFDYQVNVGQVQWGKRFGNYSLGADLNFARADISRKGTLMSQIPGLPMMIPVDVDTKTSANSYRGRIGGLYLPTEKLLLGMILEYGFQPYLTKTTTRTNLPLLPFPVLQNTETSGTQQHFILRPGLSYEYAKRSTLYLDYQMGIFKSDRDNMTDHRFNTGIEHNLFQWLFARLGTSFDLKGNFGISAGLGAYLAKWCSIQLAYQYNMLPEIEPEFGQAQTIQSALVFFF
jgi:hypothetical protein